MRRLFRILLNALTVLSLLLFVATVVLWARGYWRADRMGVRLSVPGGRELTLRVESGLGGIGLVRILWSKQDVAEYTFLSRDRTWWDSTPDPQYGTGDWKTTFGFGVMTGSSGSTRLRAWIAPAWALALSTAALPAIALRRRLRGRRIAPGLCPACGYDLCATPERCPECGTMQQRGMSMEGATG